MIPISVQQNVIQMNAMIHNSWETLIHSIYPKNKNRSKSNLNSLISMHQIK